MLVYQRVSVTMQKLHSAPVLRSWSTSFSLELHWLCCDWAQLEMKNACGFQCQNFFWVLATMQKPGWELRGSKNGLKNRWVVGHPVTRWSPRGMLQNLRVSTSWGLFAWRKKEMAWKSAWHPDGIWDDMRWYMIKISDRSYLTVGKDVPLW